jgi:hypothetical protein
MLVWASLRPGAFGVERWCCIACQLTCPLQCTNYCRGQVGYSNAPPQARLMLQLLR